jgi:hypothetical protein
VFHPILVIALREIFACVSPATLGPGDGRIHQSVLRGIFAKNCLFFGFAPSFCTDDQRLSVKFPNITNKDFFCGNRELSRDNSDSCRQEQAIFTGVLLHPAGHGPRRR